MRTQPSRVSFTVLATFLILIAVLDPVPSEPSRSALAKAPDPDQLALADWAAGRTGGSLSAMRPRDLEAALEPKRHDLALFRQTSDPLEERKFLAKLPFGRAMWRAAMRNRLDSLLLAAVVETESRFSPTAVSPDGAIGLMQVIPETGELYGKSNLFDPNVNLEVGCQYLAGLIERYHGDMKLAVAAYNAGPGAVTRYGGVPPFRETRDYVKSVLALYDDHRQSLGKVASRPPGAAPRASRDSSTDQRASTGYGLFSSRSSVAASAAR